jgi:hypothetical protein
MNSELNPTLDYASPQTHRSSAWLVRLLRDLALAWIVTSYVMFIFLYKMHAFGWHADRRWSDFPLATILMIGVFIFRSFVAWAVDFEGLRPFLLAFACVFPPSLAFCDLVISVVVPRLMKPNPPPPPRRRQHSRKSNFLSFII